MKKKRKILMYLRILIEIFILIYVITQFIQPSSTLSYIISISVIISAYIYIRRFVISKKIIESIKEFKKGENTAKNLYNYYIDLVNNYPLEESLIKISKLVNDAIGEKNDLLINNKILFDKIKHKNKILKITHEINNVFIEKDDLNIYQLILDEAIKLLPIGNYGSLLIYDSDQYHFVFKAVNGYDYDQLKEQKIDLNKTFIYKNSNNNFNDSVIIKDIYEHNKKYMSDKDAMALNSNLTKNIKETLSIPIKVNERIFGILNIDAEDSFSTSDIEILNYYANSIVFNIYNSQLLEKTIYLSRYDKLTNIYNRNFFEEVLDDIVEESIQENYYFGFVLLDMNYLKEINDNYGHRVGDNALIYLVDSIKSFLKKDDVFARLGGDEFVIIFDKMDHQSTKQRIKYILNHLIKNPLKISNIQDINELPVTFSYGISTAPNESLVLDILLKLSDKRMYEFKEEFKDKYPELKPGNNNNLKE